MVVLGERRNEEYRSWIRQNSEHTEFWRIQLRFVAHFIVPLAPSRVWVTSTTIQFSQHRPSHHRPRHWCRWYGASPIVAGSAP